MNLIAFNTVFYEDLVNMFYEYTKEVYPERTIGAKQNFYRVVESWTKNKNLHIILVHNKDEVCGFYVARISDNEGLFDTMYVLDHLYVKPDYRNGRATKLLFDNAHAFAQECGFPLSARFRANNGFADLIKKHYNAIEKFIHMDERI